VSDDAVLLAELAGESPPVWGKPGRAPTSPHAAKYRRWEEGRKKERKNPPGVYGPRPLTPEQMGPNTAKNRRAEAGRKPKTADSPFYGPATNPAVDARHSNRDIFLKGKWQELLELVSSGTPAKHAMAELGIERGMVAGITETIPEAKVVWEQAQRSQLKLRWPDDLIEDIMIDIASGEIIKDAVEKRGLPAHEFYHLALKDPDFRQMYDDAQQIRIESMAEDIVAVADDTKEDFNEYGRLNSENINRARLKVDTRKWIMSRIGWRRFGDRLQTEQNVNLTVDHASRLDAARKRVEGLRDIEGAVVDAVTDTAIVAVQ